MGTFAKLQLFKITKTPQRKQY
uniref:Uncharacterized protein n=1 Tax=Arundo donax TaxID=35708 RepID=A0A0A9FVG4_ARUDO